LEAGGEGAVAALVRDQREVGEVDGGDDEGRKGVLTVVFGVGEEGDFGGGEGGFF